jgi:hypothetical protein
LSEHRADFFKYYNESRTHLSLDKETPMCIDGAEQKQGKIVTFPGVGGLLHHYERLAA